MKPTKLIVLVLLVLLSFYPVMSQNSEDKILYFFWGDGCPHCAEEKPFLEDLQEKHPDLDIQSYEVWHNKENAALLSRMAEAYDVTAKGVPTTFVGSKVWVGYTEEMGIEIREEVERCIETGCIDHGPAVAHQLIYRSTDTLSPVNAVCVHIFLHGECEQCREIDSFLNSLSAEYNVELNKHDVLMGKELYSDFKETYSVGDTGYPIVFIGDTYFIGKELIEEHLEEKIQECSETGCICPAEKIKGLTPRPPEHGDFTPAYSEHISLPLIGKISVSSMPLFVVTGLIAFVDGFNPCSLWVLTLLLGIVIYSGSRKKTIIVGLTFLLVTSAAYGLFMLGLLNVFRYIGFLGWIRLVVALIAFLFGIVNIKDFFWYKRGISFTIPDKYKPKIFARIRDIMKKDRTGIALVFGTAIMALGITLVELPCTAGFPVVWTNIVAGHNLSTFTFALLFLLYILIYLLDELIVFVTMAVTLRASRMQEKHGRILKLIGGMIMLALGLTLLIKPGLLDDIGGSLIVFGIAIGISLLIVLIYPSKHTSRLTIGGNRGGNGD